MRDSVLFLFSTRIRKNFFLGFLTRLANASLQTEKARGTISKKFLLLGRSDENKNKTLSLLSDYIALTKPGILTASLYTTLVGYLLASPVGAQITSNDFWILLHTLLGTALVAMGAGSLNMLIETEIDSRMDRTKNRPLPQNRVSPVGAFFLGALTSSLGIVHLCSAVNLAAGFLASLTLVLYLVFYTPLKEKSYFSLIVGAASGALPPLIGWAAKSGFPLGAGWSLFLILFLWQFPHFLSLSWIYRKDYKQANLKVVLQEDESGHQTARWALLTSLAVSTASILPYALGLGGIFYLLSALTLGIIFTGTSFFFLKKRTLSSAKILFFTSIAYLPLLFLLLVLF